MVVPPVPVVVVATVIGDPAMGDPVGEATVPRARLVMTTLQARMGPLMPALAEGVAETVVKTALVGRRGPGVVGGPAVTGPPAGLPVSGMYHIGIITVPIPSVPLGVAD